MMRMESGIEKYLVLGWYLVLSTKYDAVLVIRGREPRKRARKLQTKEGVERQVSQLIVLVRPTAAATEIKFLFEIGRRGRLKVNVRCGDLLVM